jgi:hypothetical protein
MHYSNSELLTELEKKLATNLFTVPEIRTLSQILAANYAQIAQTLTFFLQQERLKQQSLLNSLTPTEREQVKEFLERHGFKKVKGIND